ncbi:hypothetical protein TIFTF001_016275 [Ficus carica]|uniref:Uncharacterized protein n=1 Tax=Ficus carica TaxID=3494 RepID=A0AA88A7H0_FICCA|nr:hypothetical protein TIFTF001_016275 [Ficus carica]
MRVGEGRRDGVVSKELEEWGGDDELGVGVGDVDLEQGRGHNDKLGCGD